MRMIKFRAWDKVSERMWYWNLKDMGCSDIGELKGGEYCGCNDLRHVIKECPIMQYTGLKDKNGKEIYEGDVVKDIDGIVFEVVFSEYSFAIERITEGGYPYNYFELKHLKPCEVIGDIYENPELLEDNK